MIKRAQIRGSQEGLSANDCCKKTEGARAPALGLSLHAGHKRLGVPPLVPLV